MSFTEWVAHHVGHAVTFEHVHWGGAGGVETHDLRGIQNDVLLLGTSTRRAPSGIPVREGWSTSPSIKSVYQLIPRIKWIEAKDGDRGGPRLRRSTR